MKFLHLADLHLGKRVNGFDMLEDQRFILEQILTLCEKHGVEAVVIAGDIYDTPVPPAAASWPGWWPRSNAPPMWSTRPTSL